jgi:hypothetical protein
MEKKMKRLSFLIGFVVLMASLLVACGGGSSPAPALTPTFGTPTATADGFTAQITNYDSSYTYTGTATASGLVSISGSGLVTVSGVASNTGSTATITTTKSNTLDGSAQVTATSLMAALTPTFGSPTATADGFTVQITNFNDSYYWSGTVTGWGMVTIDNGGLITVSGLSPDENATVTITTTRDGWPDGSAQVSASSLRFGLTPMFGPLTATPDGFTVQLFNYDDSFEWSASSSAGMVSVDWSGLVTVNGLASGQSATIIIFTTRNGWATGSETVYGTAL